MNRSSRREEAPISGPEPIFLAGPTASGKSAAALLLAEEMRGEAISVDSMQVYRGLDIGTAKPSATDRDRVPHHLIDVCRLTENFDAAEFVRQAGQAVADIQSRGRVPIFCGGTGLYFKAWLDGLGDAPPADPSVRAILEASPLSDLLRELEQNDPATFARIDRQNPRRVIRAVEIIRLSGRPLAGQRANWMPNAPTATLPNPRFFALERSMEDLRPRIDARVDQMFAAGVVDETRALLTHGLEQNRTAMQAIGYRQIVEHLRGERGLAETIELVKIRTRQFAKRQMTWFRRQLPVTWLKIVSNESAQQIADRVLTNLRRCPENR